METIIVATDFSDAAFGAGKYAAALTRQIPVTRLILYHSYYEMVTVERPLTDAEYFSELKRDSFVRLKDLKSRLAPLTAAGVVIECIANISPLQDAVCVDFVKENAELIVMGITGKSKMKEKLMGSQAVMAARNTTIPLLMIPFEATYRGIKKIVFAWDMENSEKTFPENLFKKILHILKAELLVLNVDYKNKNFGAETMGEQAFMHHSLDPEDTKYFYSNHPDAVSGIIGFAERHQADLVMVIPRKRTFPAYLFQKKVTRRLAFHIKIPLLVLPHKS
ncbi:MAG: universal stress protein [Chitinophagaceae bacterium]|nr:MAG: universal stress protein [Chitinophagaceae bacterium]